MECSVCFNQIVDKIFMTCSSQHSFCFKCILQNIEANSELKSCPNCRGGDKFIMLTNDLNTTGANGFYSLEYFKKSLPIMQKILGDSITINTCLVSENILVCYVKNKKQLDIAHKLVSLGESIDAIVAILKWDEKKQPGNVGAAEIFGMPAVFMPNQQRSQNNSREQNNGPRTANGISFSGLFGLPFSPNGSIFGDEIN